MKRILSMALALMIVLCTAGAFAAQPLGGPVDAELGKWAASVGYFYSQDRWTSNTITGDFDPKVNTYSYFGQLAYGVARGWDVYLRAGVVDAKLVQSAVDFTSNGNFFVGAGTHGTLFEKKDWHLKLGPIGNFTYYTGWTDRSPNRVPGGGGTAITSISVNEHYSFNVGFGFRWAPIEFLEVYGGPFYNYETAKLHTAGYLRGFPLSGSNNIDGDKSIGSRLGIRIPVKDQFSINFEAQMKDYFGAGGWLSFNF
jgi:hypothetical protein